MLFLVRHAILVISFEEERLRDEPKERLRGAFAGWGDALLEILVCGSWSVDCNPVAK